MSKTIAFLMITSSLMAQGFGRNKVQYTAFDWKVMETEHFDIYYYPEMVEIARHGAQYAEESFKVLQPKFNHSITRRIPLIFYSSHLYFQQTNITPGFIPEGIGGFFEFLKGRVVIPSNGNLAKFRHVIRHELVHVFMHDKIYNVMKTHGKIDGTYPPLWFTEGLAEHWSAKWDAQAEMVVKDAVLDNYVVGLQNIYQIAGTFTMYKLGQHLLNYIEDNYGDDKILLMMENLWKHNLFEESFKEAIGKDFAEFDKEYMIALKKQYYPQLAHDDFNSIQTETVARDGFNLMPAYYKDSHGEEQVVFVGNRTGYASIFMKTMTETSYLDDEEVEVLVKGEASSNFESFHIFDSKIDVNKDGLLAFTSKSGETDVLYIYDIPNRKILSSRAFKNLVGLFSPAWSPDGKEIVFSGLSKAGFSDIYIYNRDYKYLIQLTNDFYNDITPSWAPDGNHIAFSSDRSAYGQDGSSNIFMIDKNGQGMRYLTYGNQIDQAPVFSPDGKKLAYTSDQSGSYNINIIENPLSPNPQKPLAVSKITHSVGAIFDPEWTQYGDLLFGTFEQRSFQIRLLNDVNHRIEESNSQQQEIVLPISDLWDFKKIGHSKIRSNKPYVKEFQLDFVQTQVSQDPVFGTSGGAQMALTDMLGNEQYYFVVYNSDRFNRNILESLSFAATKVNLGKKVNYAYGIYRFAGTYYNREESFYFEDRAGGHFAVSYPFSQFDRLEFNQNLSYSDKDYGIRRRNAWLNSSFSSYVYDNSIWTYTGPIDGRRIKVAFGNTYDFAFSNVNYLTGLVDARFYFRTSLRSTYAVRALSLFNQGKESRLFYFGGSWDFRGYDIFSLRGKRIFLLSQEFRFPLIDLIGVKLPIFSLGFYQIRGALFFDIAEATQSNLEQSPMGSFGGGIRLPLGSFLVLRWDIGKKTTFKTINDGYFTKFFFGWDF